MEIDSLKTKILVASVSAIIVCGGYYIYNSSPDEEIILEESIETSNKAVEIEEESNKIVIYVTGAVQNPGIVEILENSRVLDAVNAAGGVTSNADLEAINMAQKVKDGQHLTVPEISDQNTTNQSRQYPQTKSQASNKIININTASEDELTSLPGIGSATAKKIIDYRENNGAFIEIEDIKKVRGIGESKFQSLKDLITT